MVPDFFPRISISRVVSLYLGWFCSIPSPVWLHFSVIL
uniref:Uncharacterized protein n=1 Tax=Trichinella nativa TaxID=6335 RepID=A0A0V1KGY4_9BILA